MSGGCTPTAVRTGSARTSAGGGRGAPLRAGAFAWCVAAAAATALLAGPGRTRAAEPPGSAALAERAYQAGNRAYREARFVEALRLYDVTRATGLRAPQLEYNRANALLKTGQLGRAIAGYERARRMGMEDDDLRASLRYARALTRDPRPPEGSPRLARIAGWVQERVSAERTFWAGWGLLVLAAGLAVARRAGGRGRATGWIGGLLVAGLVAQALGVARQVQVRHDRHAVILGTEVPVRSGPGTDFGAQVVLHEGTLVRVGRDAGPWREIELSSDVAGWVPATSLEPI